MCGISGVITNHSERLREVYAMTKLIQHRGPDAEGFHFTERFAFGHRRLAILDLSPEGNQPMSYRDHWITYNGEIYNYIELRKTLQTLGYQFKTNTDTEVILAAYIHWGTSCVDQFNGMWSFAIYDPRNHSIFCSRDRYGIKPFYYTEQEGTLYFASEIKQFTATKNWNPTINKQIASSFFSSTLHNHSENTLFKTVKQLRGGHNLIYDLKKGNYSISRYYTPKIQTGKLSIQDAIEQYKDLLWQSVSLRLRADVRIGTSLSGGVDSSSIVGIIHKILEERKISNIQETVTACFEYKQFNEEPYVDHVIQATKVNAHKVFPNLKDFESHFDKLTWHQDEPVPSIGMLAQYIVFKTAKEKDLTVMLDGQGADEVLGGYFGFYQALLRENLSKNQYWSFLKHLCGIPYYQIHQTRQAIQAKRARIKTQALNPFDTKRTALEPSFQADSPFLQKSFDAIFDTSLPALLHYEDRNSMAWSVESRVPFLDYRLVEFTIGLPTNYKIRNGIRKFILRESCKNVLPKPIYKRYDKLGFVTPQDIWIKNNPSLFKPKFDSALKQLNDLNQTDLKIEFEDFFKANKTDTSSIWKTIAFANWMKQFNIS